ncbi:unnamed protein product, partial [Allacma fusca]
TYEEANSKIDHYKENSDYSENDGVVNVVVEKSRAGRPIKRIRLNSYASCDEGIPTRKPAVMNVLPYFPIDESARTFQDLHNNDAADLDTLISLSEDEEIPNEPVSAAVLFPGSCSEKWDDFLPKFTAFQTVFFRNRATIQANQSSLLRMVESLVHSSNVNAIIPAVGSSRPVFGFPFKSKEALLEFDQKLVTDCNYKTACVKYLSSIGGSDLTVTVNEALYSSN